MDILKVHAKNVNMDETVDLDEIALATSGAVGSINTIQGECFLASENKSRTREAPTPTNISTKSEPDREKKGT